MLIQSQRQKETPYVDSIYSQMSQDNAETNIGITDFPLTLSRLCLHVPANILKPTLPESNLNRNKYHSPLNFVGALNENITTDTQQPH